jgi:ArsR family transcriptional regulator
MVAISTIPSPDAIFRACSDRTRLRLLNLLRGGEVCVCDLVAVLRLPQPKISRHLAYLKKAGLVSARKDGLWMHYDLAKPAGQFHRSLLACLKCCGECLPQMDSDAARLKKLKGKCCLPSDKEKRYSSASCC